MAERSVNIRLSLKDGEVVKRALMSLGEEGQRALKRIEAGGVPASRALLAVDTAAKEAKASVSNWAAEAGAGGRVLMAFGPAGLAAAAGIGATVFAGAKLIDWAKQAATELDQLKDTADRLGVGTDFLQGIRFAAGQMGADIEKVDGALDALNQRLGDVARGGNQQAAEAFKRLGVSITDAQGHVKTLEQILPDLADGFTKLGSEQERASIATDLFGRGNQNFARILAQGSTELERQIELARQMGAVIDADLVRKGAEAHDKLEALALVIRAQLNSALIGATPLIIKMAEAFAAAAKAAGDFVDSFNALNTQRLSTLQGELADINKTIAAASETAKGSSFLPESLDVAAMIAKSNLPGLIAQRDAIQLQIERLGRTGLGAPSPSQGTPIADLAKPIAAATTATKDHTERTLEDVEAQEKLIAAEMRAGALYDTLTRAGMARGDALRAEAAALQAAHTQQEIHNRLKSAGVTEDSAAGQAIVAEVTALGRLKLAQEETSHAREEAGQIIDDTRTREEQYAEKLNELNYLLRQGAIDQDAYNRAVAKYSPAGQMAQEAVDASRDSLRQFVFDADRAALAGGDFWASFAQAGITALTSLQEKLLGLMLDLAIGKQGDTGFGFLGQLLGGLFGGSTPATPVGSPQYGGPRAEGGDAWPGRIYRVNERGSGSEYFAPGMAGRVVSNAQIRQAMAGGDGSGSSGPPVVNIINQSGAEVQAGPSRRRTDGGWDIDAYVRGVVQDEMASPGGQLLAKRVYGVGQPPIRRR